MSISAGNKIVASDIFTKFKNDISSDLADVKSGVAALASALSSTGTTPPIYKFYANKYAYDSTSIVEELMSNLQTLETTYDASWNGQSLATPRHLQPTFDATEASGRVVQHDFIGAYHLRAFIESLHAIAANLRNVELSFSSPAVELTARIPFNDFALNNSDSTASALATGTLYATQLSDEHYVNTNLAGRQIISNLTAIDDTSNKQVITNPSAALSTYYDTTPSSWTIASETGVAKQYNELTGINYPSAMPGGHDPTPTKTKLSAFYANSGTDKIISKECGTKHVATAATVTGLFTECKALLTSLKVDLLGSYIKRINTPTDLALPFAGYGSIGYPYSKNWFISKATASNTYVSLSAFGITNSLTSAEVVKPGSAPTNYGAVNKSLRNDEWAAAESWYITNPVRVGYSAMTSVADLRATYYVPMPLTYTRSPAVHADLSSSSNTYLSVQPSALHYPSTEWIYLDQVPSAATSNMRRVCISWPNWSDDGQAIPTTTVDNIRHYYTFLSSYKSLISGANNGVQTLTSITPEYRGQCVVSGYYGRGADATVRSVLSSADTDITANTIKLALSKYNAATSANTIITSDADMPANLGFTITSWAIINEVNHSHGTAISSSYAIDNTSNTIELARYSGGQATTATVITSIPLTGIGNIAVYVQHTTTSADIPAVLENAMYRFRYRYAALYGDTDLLAKKSLDSIKNDINDILKIGNENIYFQGCAGGVAATTYVVKRLAGTNQPYGAATIPTFKFAAGMRVFSSSHSDSVSQGYVGYEGFQFSYDITGATISAIAASRDTNLLSFIPLPDDITVYTLSTPSAITTHHISVSSTHWWDVLSAVVIYDNTDTQITSLTGTAISNPTDIDTGIPNTTPITSLYAVGINDKGGKIYSDYLPEPGD